jgi:hypothetical protein
VAEILAFDGSMEKGTAKFPLFFRCFPLFLRKNTLGTGRRDECRQRYFHYGLRDTYFANMASKTRFVNSMKSL